MKLIVDQKISAIIETALPSHSKVSALQSVRVRQLFARGMLGVCSSSVGRGASAGAGERTYFRVLSRFVPTAGEGTTQRGNAFLKLGGRGDTYQRDVIVLASCTSKEANGAPAGSRQQ